MPDTLSHVQRTERFDLRALYETSRLLSSSLDLDFVLGNLLLTAMSKLLVTRGAILLYDPVESVYRTAVSKGLSGLKKGEVFPLKSASSDRILSGSEVPSLLAERKIELAMSIAFGHRDIGLLALGKKATGQPFERQELEFLESLVYISSAAVHNSLMVEDLTQANRDLDSKIQQLGMLFELSQEFNRTVSQEGITKMLSFALMGQMLVGKYVFLLRRSTGAKEASGTEDSDFKIVTHKGVNTASLHQSVLRSLCRLSNVVLLPNEEKNPVNDWLYAQGLSLVLPLKQHGETCAILCLGPKLTGLPYQQDDLELLYSLGNMAFVALQNFYLIEEQIEKERLEEEMRLARQIQMRLLPQRIPSFPEVEVATLALPSRQVGGDYFDVVKLEGRRLLLAIADVTGKGVPASLLMANLQACLHVMVPMDLTIEEATSHINRVICENTDHDKFITYFHGIYHAEDGAFHYVNAGHNPPMLLRKNGELELLEKGGLLLGVMKGLPYERGEVFLERGDVLALFTDGVTEAMNADEEEYGEERLEKMLRANQHHPARYILDAIYGDIQVFTGTTSFLSDDLTMIVMKKGG